MLILTRYIGEKVKIGDNITVKLLEIKEGQAQIGIEAPREIKVGGEKKHFRILKKHRRNKLDKERL